MKKRLLTRRRSRERRVAFWSVNLPEPDSPEQAGFKLFEFLHDRLQGEGDGVCEWKRTAHSARRPFAGAVPGRWGLAWR
jgi:hypothetical protein